MSSQNKWIIGVVVILLILVGGTFYASKKKEAQNNSQNDTAQNLDQNSNSNSGNLITAKHSFSNGKHIIAGEVEVPTPCTSIKTDVRVAESMPEQVTLAFTTSGEGDVCAQVISSRRFKVEFSTSQNAKISATWNGKPITLNLIPSSVQDLESFDIYIKG